MFWIKIKIFLISVGKWYEKWPNSVLQSWNSWNEKDWIYLLPLTLEGTNRLLSENLNLFSWNKIDKNVSKQN
jgi:hypothetical protein